MNPIGQVFSRSDLYADVVNEGIRSDVEEKTDPSTEASFEEENLFNPAGYLFTKGTLKVDQLIGSGAFGAVYSGTMEFNNCSRSFTEVAVKINIITKKSLTNKITISSIEREAMLLRRVYLSDRADQKNIVRYVDSGRIDDNKFALITKICTLDLFEYIKAHKNRKISEGNISSILQQTISGLRHLHNMRPSILHCDLKPSNILIDSYEDPRVRIADLGSALEGPQENEAEMEVVTRWYRSPEILLGAPFDCSSDIWSVGCIAYELATRQPLFPANNDIELLQMHHQILAPITEDVLVTVKDCKKDYFESTGKKSESFYLKDEYASTSRFKDRFEEINHKFPYFQGNIRGDYDVSFNRAFRSFIFGILKWSPKRRSTSANLLQSELISSFKSENILAELMGTSG